MQKISPVEGKKNTETLAVENMSCRVQKSKTYNPNVRIYGKNRGKRIRKENESRMRRDAINGNL